MFGLDELVSGLGQGANPAVVLGVAALLGLRHASDPDHLVAVSTLVATERDRRVRRAWTLGLSWGAGHATSLTALGLPFVLAATLLPRLVQEAAETLVGLVVAALALRLLSAWRSGRFHAHPHVHGPVVHRHVHPHELPGHAHRHRVRSPLQAYGIGLLHGAAGSAAVAVLLLASIESRVEAVAALALFAAATALSMGAVSAAFGLALGAERARRSLAVLAPVLAAGALVFGAAYAAAALGRIAGV